MIDHKDGEKRDKPKNVCIERQQQLVGITRCTETHKIISLKLNWACLAGLYATYPSNKFCDSVRPWTAFGKLHPHSWRCPCVIGVPVHANQVKHFKMYLNIRYIWIQILDLLGVHTISFLTVCQDETPAIGWSLPLDGNRCHCRRNVHFVSLHSGRNATSYKYIFDESSRKIQKLGVRQRDFSVRRDHLTNKWPPVRVLTFCQGGVLPTRLGIWLGLP